MTMELDVIYNEDCLEGMKRIPDGSVDCIICDLPYGVLHRNNPHAQWDRMLPLAPMWEQYKRVIKGNGAILLFCQGMFTARLMMSQPKLWRYNLIWSKGRATGFLNANRMPLRCHEDIAVFYKKLPTYNPQMQDLNPGQEPNHPRGSGKHRHTNQCYGAHRQDTGIHPERCYERVPKTEPTSPDKKFPRSIIEIKRDHESKMLHPTQKPVELIRYLIRTYTNKGGLVLDNCMGSGTTAIAAMREERRFIGFELDTGFYEAAVRRIHKETSQLTLF